MESFLSIILQEKSQQVKSGVIKKNQDIYFAGFMCYMLWPYQAVKQNKKGGGNTWPTWI